VVDWETLGKRHRQKSYDTQINDASLADLCTVRASTDATVICRINGFNSKISDEVEKAIGAGADEILLPMVRSVNEVQRVLDLVNGRCNVAIMLETVASINIAEDLARLPLSRVYVGLNDLGIERKTPNIFSAMVDGTVEYMQSKFSIPFGLAGLTLPDLGNPIPCRLLIAEMARLNCDFSFLRRSFHRDIKGRDMRLEIPRILYAVEKAKMRCPDEVSRDKHDLDLYIKNWSK
jgi:hypothetical protein